MTLLARLDYSNMKPDTRSAGRYGALPLSRISADNQGFTVIELMVVMAIIAIVGAVIIPNLRPILGGREAQAAIQSIQQTVWQGATAAAARGVVVELTRTGNTFILRNTDTNGELKRFVLPSGVSTNWPVSTPLRFTPPGKVDTNSMVNFPNTLTVTGNGKTTILQISLIGEVRAGS